VIEEKKKQKNQKLSGLEDKNNVYQHENKEYYYPLQWYGVQEFKCKEGM
jgi:hypothetical protein